MITVIVPIHNNEKTLPKCLNSIRLQTYTDLDVVLVDAGSTDQSREVCENYAKSDSRFHPIYTETLNDSAIKNLGISKAKGEYICFVHPLDFIDREMIEVLVNAVSNYNADMVTCRYYVETPDKLSIVAGPETTAYMNKKEAVDLCLAQKRAHGFLCNKLFKLDLFRAEPAIRFDEKVNYYEDLLVTIQCFLKSRRIVYSPPPHYHYVVHRHAKRDELTKKEKLTGLKAIKETMQLLKSLPEFDMNTIKEHYIDLSLKLLHGLIEEKRVDQTKLNELKQDMLAYEPERFTDRHLKIVYRTTKSNTTIGHLCWKLFYDHQAMV